MRQFLLGLYFLCFLNVASGQEIPLPENMPQEHPRVLTTPEGKRETWNQIKTEAWAEDEFNKLKERTEAYTRLTDVQPTWLLSRLAMFISVNRKVGRIRLVLYELKQQAPIQDIMPISS